MKKHVMLKSTGEQVMDLGNAEELQVPYATLPKNRAVDRDRYTYILFPGRSVIELVRKDNLKYT